MSTTRMAEIRERAESLAEEEMERLRAEIRQLRSDRVTLAMLARDDDFQTPPAYRAALALRDRVLAEKCSCGHARADHVPAYWPTEQVTCRRGHISEEDVGISCVCTEFLPVADMKSVTDLQSADESAKDR